MTATQDTPRFRPNLADCRIGDWQHAGLAFEWWGEDGVRKYQPGARDSFDESSFSAARPVWLFKRSPHPCERLPMGQPCAIWKRIA